MTNVGCSAAMSATDSIRQQSPSLGKPPTGATSAHHLVTPTNNFFAPIAHNIEVALGASDTMRKRARLCLTVTGKAEQTLRCKLRALCVIVFCRRLTSPRHYGALTRILLRGEACAASSW